jgi:hypothetical protein
VGGSRSQLEVSLRGRPGRTSLPLKSDLVALWEVMRAEGTKSGVGMKTEIKKCECGIVWELKCTKSPFGTRDTDSIACSCERKVITWRGGYMWVGEVMPD